MLRKSKRFLSLLCALVVLISSYAGYAIPVQVNAAVASNPVSSELQLDTKYDTFEDTDISVMSYNVLAHNATNGTYENQTTRSAKVVKMIETYSPDVIGIQEAAVEDDFNWANYLTTELSNLGYGVYRRATSMTIGNGLMIFYKTSRFSEVSDPGQSTDGSDAFKGSILYGTDASIGANKNQARYFQWIMLKDKVTGQQFMVYNTHFSVLSADNGGHTERTKEAQELVNHVAAWKGTIPDRCKATMYPVFITGDFNADFTGDYKATMDVLHDKTYLDDAATIADYTRFVYPKEEIDHIFVNPKFVDVKEYHAALESINGRRTSDHLPHIAYCNFKADATVNGVDTSNRNVLIETNTNSYTLDIGLGSRVGYKLYSEDGAEIANGSGGWEGKTVSNTLTLNKAQNRFTIKFFDGGHSDQNGSIGKYVCTVEVIITNTSVSTAFAPSGAVNSYFANDAYHVLVNDSTNTLSLSASGATFYTTADASGSAVTSANLSAGRTVRYLKTTAGDIYPVYIYKKTATADSSIVYVDDDIPTGESGEQVAFYDGKDVIFVTRGTNGFATVAEAAAKANAKADSTVLFAPGKYSVNNTDDSVVFNQNVTLLGNNHNVSAVNKVVPNWSLASRNEETVIDGSFIFRNGSDISVTVKGFTFAGTSNYGPIFIDDTSAEATRVTHIQTIDIQNNIFTGGGNGTVNGASALRAYSGAQVKGLIKNNYFRCTVNQKGLNADWVAGQQTRGLSIKNSNGLEIDSNYFRGYELLGDFTDEISSSVAGNLNYAVSNNRFEHCGTIRNAIKNIQSSTSANIVYYNNDVLRCGPYRRGTSLYFVNFDFTEGSLGNVCSNINIVLFGNRFTDCYRVFKLMRGKSGQTGNLAEMKFTMNKNHIIDPTEGDLSGHEFYIGRFDFYLDSQNTKEQPFPTNWDISDNYYKSRFLEDTTVITTCTKSGGTNDSYTNSKHTEAARTMRKYYQGITELDYIWNLTAEEKTVQQRPFAINDDSIFKAKNYYSYDTIAEAFNGAVGLSEDGYAYDFDNDLKNMQILRGISSIRDRFTFNATAAANMSITEDLALRMEGFAQFYSDNRWSEKSKISMDLKMDGTPNDFAGFYVKYGKENVTNTSNSAVFFETDGVREDGKNSTTGTTGIGFSFRTTAGVDYIEIFVKYLNGSGNVAVQGVSFYDVVTNFREFNNYTVIDDGAGTIEFYANDVLFATLTCTNAKVPTLNTSYKEQYYSNVTIVDETQMARSSSVTVSNALVSAEGSALAFGTRNEYLEIDNLMITNNTEIIEEPETPTPDDPIVDTPGTITITNAQAGVNYSAYKMANVTYNEESDAYSYKVADGWEEFFAGTGDYAVVLDVYSVNGNVITKRADADESKMPEIARLAVKYAQENNITAAGSATADGNGTAVINVSSAGYYVVDSALGALCSVGTFNGSDGNVNIQEKNDVPTLQKFVKEEDTWQKANDESIGNIVEFKILVYVAKGAKGYVVHDTLGDGFTAPTKVVVKQYSSYVNNGAATLTKTYVSGNHYTVSISGNSLTVTFNDDTIENVPVGNILEITYQASIDTDAAIDAANVNTAYMQYGETEGLQTVSVITNTYVWSFGIHKYYGNDIRLPGARFELYDTNPVGNGSATLMQFVYDAQKDTYRLASQADIDDINIPTTSILVSPDTGDYRIQGLDSATYYLVEKEAPNGFNKLGAPIAVTIASSQVDNTETQLKKLVTAKQGLDDVAIIDGDIIPVLNQSGIVLPDTGGYASVFVAVGCMMVMSMGILLVVRKRMTKVIYIKNDDYYEEFDD